MSTPQQNATYAVIGYVSNEVAKSLGSHGYGKGLEVRTERGSDHEIVRIKADDIVGVLQGASQKGETSVQVLLRDKAVVETASHGVASELHLRPISDLSVVFKRPPINVIYIDPRNIAKLTEISKA